MGGAQLRHAERSSDRDEGDLCHELRRDVGRGGRERDGRADAAQRKRACSDEDSAELRERQYVACRVADLPGDQKVRQVRAGARRKQGIPACREDDDQTKRVGADERKSAHANGANRRKYRRRADVKNKISRNRKSDCGGNKKAKSHGALQTRAGVERKRNRRASLIIAGTKRGRSRRSSYSPSLRSFSVRQTSISSPISMSAPNWLAPVTVKLLSCTPLLTLEAMPIRSQTRNAQTASTLISNQGRRHCGMFRR